MNRVADRKTRRVPPTALLRGALVAVLALVGPLSCGDPGTEPEPDPSQPESAEGWAAISGGSTDRAALVALYNATDGPNWVDSENWLTDAPLDDWHGVDTDASGRVVEIDLSGGYDRDSREWVPHGLSGEIPPELGGLTRLERLYLEVNDLSGRIPAELGALANLERLYLERNNLSGAIPPELGTLAKLERLYLADNRLSGEIPPVLEALANLNRLYLGDNELSGEIPPELGGLARLERLYLGDNALWGAIPPELGRLANLKRLYLHENELSGGIPPELGTLAKLERLYLQRNMLSGGIPPELGGLSKLKRLRLYRNYLSGAIPPELGALASLEWMHLEVNGLSGGIPPELGALASLEELSLNRNELSGEVPRTFLNMPLKRFAWGGPGGVCVPGTSDFVAWVKRMEDAVPNPGPYCSASDQAVLSGFFDLTGGSHWTKSDGWLGGPALEEWHGVGTDSLGRVTSLALNDNGLSGGLPHSVANLRRMKRLRVDGNALGGRLPLSLAALDLEALRYDDTELCVPQDDGFRAWLNGIGSHVGTGVGCAPPTDRDALVALYEAAGGPGWWNDGNWLTDASLDLWHGVEVDSRGRVVGLDLGFNGLSGVIPPELGGLARLRWLYVGWNGLSGEIPPELGGLARLERLYLLDNRLSGEIPPELGGLENLERLDLSWNSLSGEIPPELGDLANLERLHLSRNDLSGEIPPELGELANLEWLFLEVNGLSGEIPPELGELANLESLRLEVNGLSGEIPPELGKLARLGQLRMSGNDLSGSVPSEFGGLYNLIQLELSHNRLAGAMPAGLKKLELESLMASGTELCVPREPAFEGWLAAIPRRRIALCGEPPAAYLVQAVQSRAHPVPLVAGEEALLRVFVTAASETDMGIPEVRARFYLDGSEEHVADIPRSATPIPTEIDEGDLSKSANAEIPDRIVRPGLEMVVEIDHGGTLDESLGVPTRIPAEGRLAVDVREMPVLDLTVIPFLWSSDPDSAIVGLVEGMAADPEGHDLLEETHVLLPVGEIDVTAHAPVASATNNAFRLLYETEAIRVLEGGGGHYMGMMSGTVTGAGGVAYVPGRSNFSQTYSSVVAHELGHNMSLWHAPCGGAAGADPGFPDSRGAIGAWGYDFRHARLVPATRKDHMSYCNPDWTSDYHFTNALRHRLVDEADSASALAAAPARSLLLWGGVDATGTPFLDPVFVADAPPALPDSAGDWTVIGRDAGGRELFSLSFAMQAALAEEAEASSFVFALPARTGWADALASVTLSGPAGTATLDGDGDAPMAILRDPVTGQVRGFLRDVGDPAAARRAAAGALAWPAGGLEVLFSRGIPAARAGR